MPSLNARASSVGISPTMAAAAALCKHPDPVDLTVGEPDFLPPQEAREAACRVISEGRTKYGPAAGLPALRDAVSQDLARRDGVARSTENTLMTAGGKAAIHDALRCILEPGDEVLIFAPYWPTFKDQVTWCGGVPVIVQPGADLLPALEAIDAALTSRTRAVILNQPSNPTGRIWDEPRLAHLAKVARERGLWVILDQVYGTVTYDGPERPFLAQAPDLADRCVVVESFSKRFAMTGYRLGSATAPAPLIKAMVALASSTVTHPSIIAQHAALAALALDGSWQRETVESLRDRRDKAHAALSGIPGLQAHLPQGALYLFPRVADWMAAHGVEQDSDLVARLRDEAGVKTLSGAAFGAPGHLRLSIAAPAAELERGLERLKTFFR
nr:aminotransferase class I/II-fold pyridoxal phosphate-dependent enzyme [uncultured Holophaga sp.]